MDQAKLRSIKRRATEKKFPYGMIQGNAVAIPLRDASVDLIVTSPPYFALRRYEDGDEMLEGQVGAEPTPQDFLEALWMVTAECARVLKPGGSIWVNLGDKYAGSGGHNNAGVGGTGRGPSSYNKATIGGAQDKSLMGLPWRYAIGCVDDLGLILRRDQVWSKPNGMPETVRDRCRSSHEYWFHMTKEPTYFATMDEIREPHAEGTAKRYAAGYNNRDDYNEARINSSVDMGGDWSLNEKGKVPGSVWEITTEPFKAPEWLGIKHRAAFPQEWPRRLILGWSPEGGVVFDPFGGTGTTAMVARALGRYGVTMDLSAGYNRLARWRIERSHHDQKTIVKTNEERVARGEGLLLKPQLRARDWAEAKAEAKLP